MEGIHKCEYGNFPKGAEPEGLGNEVPMGSRGKAPVGSLGTKSPRS